MAELDIDSLNAMSADELAERLAGSPEERAAIVRTAAEADVAQAQALYGQMLLDGVGVAKDERAALSWFAKAPNQNPILAINTVGLFYERGLPRLLNRRTPHPRRSSQLLGGRYCARNS